MSSNTELDVIRNIIAEVLEVGVDQIEGSVNFITDLGTDSLRIIEILARLESALQIQINQAQLGRMVSLDAVVEVVQESQQVVAA